MAETFVDPQAIFLNVPYDRGYQPLFVTLVTTLVCLGQKPRCVLEIRETGRGRLARLERLMASCRVSIHDLCRQGTPARLNMPFELGLACAQSLRDPAYEIVVLDAKPYRLDKTLSDYKGRDPLIHNNRCDELVTCLLDLIEVPDEPPPSALRQSARLLRGVAGTIASQYKLDTIFRASAYRILVAAAMEHAKEQGYIAA